MTETPRDKYAKSICSIDIKRTLEMEEELNILESKYRIEQSDMENDRVDDNGIQEGIYLTHEEEERMKELQLFQKTYLQKQDILNWRISQSRIDLYNDLKNIASSKSIFDI